MSANFFYPNFFLRFWRFLGGFHVWEKKFMFLTKKNVCVFCLNFFFQTNLFFCYVFDKILFFYVFDEILFGETSFGKTSFGKLHLTKLHLTRIGYTNPFPGFAKFSIGYYASGIDFFQKAGQTDKQTNKQTHLLNYIIDIGLKS